MRKYETGNTDKDTTHIPGPGRLPEYRSTMKVCGERGRSGFIRLPEETTPKKESKK